jgi:lipoate-protein ligase B
MVQLEVGIAVGNCFFLYFLIARILCGDVTFHVGNQLTAHILMRFRSVPRRVGVFIAPLESATIAAENPHLGPLKITAVTFNGHNTRIAAILLK